MKYWSLIFGVVGVLILISVFQRRRVARVEEFDDEIRFELYAQ